MSQEKYIGMDVHQATISVAVMDSSGKLITIYDPQNAVINSDGTVTRTPFAGNINLVAFFFKLAYIIVIPVETTKSSLAV